MFVYKLFSFWRPKNKSQKPLNWKITSSKLIYRKSNTFSYIIPKTMKTMQGNCFMCIVERKRTIFVQENSYSLTGGLGEEVFFLFTASQHEPYEPHCQKLHTEVQGSYFWQQVHPGKLLRSLVWPCSCWHWDILIALRGLRELM